IASVASAHDDELSRMHRPAARDHHEQVTQWLHEAGIARAEGRWVQASTLLDSVAALAPHEPALARCRAQLALDQGQPASALAALGPHTARERDPRVLELRVEALARLDRFHEAALLADTLLAARSGVRIEHVLLRARIALECPAEGATGAIRVLDAGLARWPGAWPLVERAIELEQSLGRFDAALARLDALRGERAADAVWLARRGDVLASARRPWEARAAWTDALAQLAHHRTVSAADRALEARLHTRLSDPVLLEPHSPSTLVGVPR
ncbi:MAG: tetratricopeptide repeat protein, partial [Candidatus Eisenbacteria bacterium]|nr:tetratricopeptide repeat protein [Candidatus Eisenbacteria bacterium]